MQFKGGVMIEELKSIIKLWRELATGNKAEEENAPMSRLRPYFHARADVYTNCADKLQQIVDREGNSGPV